MLFSKYVGSGNDFILIDNRELSFPAHDRLFISKLCHRQFGIGADGVILLENSEKADFKMRIFNADGSEAEMCGNGIRCFFKYAQEKGFNQLKCLIETKEAIIRLSQDNPLQPDQITAEMQDPIDMNLNMDLAVDTENLKVHYLNTGVPHAVIFREEIKDSDLKVLGPQIRNHPQFLPKGTNVNFATVTGINEVAVRTYERGVEDETLGCGTGATASAIAAALLLDVQLPVRIKTKSGEELEINFTTTQSIIKDVTMKGPAVFVYSGKF